MSPLPPFPSQDQARDELIGIISALSYLTGPEMKLASGKTSTIYFNMKPTMMDARGAFLIGLLILTASSPCRSAWLVVSKWVRYRLPRQ